MIIDKNKPIARLLAPAVLLLCTTAVCQAGDEGVGEAARSASSTTTSLEEIIVTARKHSEDTQSVPESVTAISADMIANAHLVNLDDLNSVVSNLNITQRGDNTPDVVMRGVGTFGVVQGIGFYVNDVQLFEGQTVRPEDIDRIEVLKGPQGTLYGGSNIGGAIKYITKEPTDVLAAEGTVEGGNEKQWMVSGAVSGPLTDRLKARLSLFSSGQGGYIYDPFLQRTLGKGDEQGGRLTVGYDDGSTKVKFYLSADQIRTQNENLYYTPPDEHTYLRTVNDGTVPSYDRELYAPTVQVEHDFGRVTLMSISSYFHSSIESLTDLDKHPLPILDYVQDFKKRVWSEELRLIYNSGSRLRWLLGAFAQGIESNTAQITNIGLASVTGNQQDTAIIASVPLLYDHHQRDYAIFGDAVYDLSRWSLEGGLRISHYRNSMNDTTTVCAPCAAAVQDTEVLPKVSVSYHFTDDVLSYLSVARGFENGDLIDEPDENGIDVVHPFKAEHAVSYELGLKSMLLDRRLRLNAAAFLIDYDHRLFETNKLTSAGIIAVLQNIGASRNYGVELDATLRPISSLTLSAGIGLTRAIWRDAPFFDAVTNSTINLKGLSAPNAPQYQANVAADWRQPVGQRFVLGARVDARFVGRSWWDPQDHFAQTPYHVADAAVWLEVGRHWRIEGHVTNLFDVKYNTAYYNSADLGAPYNVAGINRPREWFLGLTARY